MSDFADQRMKVCNNCPYNESNLCILCGCDVVYKTAQAEESCPFVPPKWVAQSAVPIIKPDRVSETPVVQMGSSAPAKTTGATCLPCQARSR